MPVIDQRRLIYKLNAYLEWHNLPIRLSEYGICNGLASLCCKYFLENKQDIFFTVLEKISAFDKYSDIDDNLNHFIVELVLTFDPKEYNKSLNQAQSIQAIKIDEKTIKPFFTLSLATNDKNWIEIFTDLDLQQDEIIQLSSINHVVTINKTTDGFIVYDPNYETGFKKIKDIKKLIRELHGNVFHYSRPNMGLELNIFSIKEQTRTLLSASDIYKKYLTKSNIDKVAKSSGMIFNTLERVAACGRQADIDELISLGADLSRNNYAAIHIAISENNIEALKAMLNKIPFTDETKKLYQASLVTALEYGRMEACKILLEKPEISEIFRKLIDNLNHATELMQLAAGGGNPELLKYLIENIKPHNLYPIHSLVIQKYIKGKNAIDLAIDSGCLGSVRIFMNILLNAKIKLNELEKMRYLVKAININNPPIVRELINQVDKDSLKRMTFTAGSIWKTDLGILALLKEKGAKFSNLHQAIIRKKEHLHVGFKLEIGIILAKFTDFIRYIFKDKRCVKFESRFFEKSPQEPKSKETNDEVTTINSAV